MATITIKGDEEALKEFCGREGYNFSEMVESSKLTEQCIISMEEMSKTLVKFKFSDPEKANGYALTVGACMGLLVSILNSAEVSYCVDAMETLTAINMRIINETGSLSDQFLVMALTKRSTP